MISTKKTSNSLRRVFSLLLILAMVFGVLSTQAIAYTNSKTYWLYSLNDKYAEIWGYNDNGQTSLTIPSTINGYKTKISSLYPTTYDISCDTEMDETDADLSIINFSKNTSVKTITIPADVCINTEISSNIFGQQFSKLEAVQVSGTSDKYYSENGILFSKLNSRRKLLCYPPNKSGESYSILNNTDIGLIAFYGNNNLKSVTIPSSCEFLMSGDNFIDPFMDCENLSNFTTQSGSYFTTDANGVLYYGFSTEGYDLYVLYHCPQRKNIETFSPKYGCFAIAQGGLYNYYIKSLVLNTCIRNYTLYAVYLPNLTDVNFTESFFMFYEYGVTYSDVRTIANNIVNNSGSKKVKNVIVDTDNEYIKTVDNVLYSADMTEIIAYPPGLEQELFVLPESVTTIYSGAFRYLSSVEKISVLKHNTTMHISAEQFRTIGPTIFANGGTFKAICSNVSQDEIDSAKAELTEQLKEFDDLLQKLKTTNPEDLSEDEQMIYFLLTLSTMIYGYTDIEEYVDYAHELSNFELKVCDESKKTVSINDFEIKYKNSTKLNPEINAAYGVEYVLEYKSSDPSIVSVDKDGNVNALGRGDATITVTATDTNGNVVEDTCNVHVNFSFGQWLIWILLLGFLWY